MLGMSVKRLGRLYKEKRCPRKTRKNTKMTNSIIFKDESYLIQGAIFDVYREMGCGFLESVYQECLEKELSLQNIPFVSQQELKLQYKGQALNQIYKSDIVCYNSIIIELKALSKITPQHKAQVMNYLKASGVKLGLLVNFGSYPRVTMERIVL